MKTITILTILIVTIIKNGACDCGCLKCSKNLHVVSAPHSPCKVIYRGSPTGCKKPIPYSVETPLIMPPLHSLPESYDYKVTGFTFDNYIERPCAHGYEVQTPVMIPKIPIPITGLVAKPDRVVLPAPVEECVDYEDKYDHPCRPIFPDNYHHPPKQHYRQITNDCGTCHHREYVKPPCYNRGPIFEHLPDDLYKIACECRYAPPSKRRKRELPILKNSINFIMGLLPGFIKFPIEQTFKTLTYHPKPQYHQPVMPIASRWATNHRKLLSEPPPKTRKMPFLKKLETLNGDKYRDKRSVTIDDDEISLPFFRVTDIENDLESSEEESTETSDDEEQEHDFLKPLNFNHLVPHNPIFYLLNTPIRFLHHFHKFGQQLSPVVKSMPHILINSRRFIRNLRKNVKSDVLNMVSETIGDFDDLNPSPYLRHLRHRRSIINNNQQPYEPEYTLVFQNDTLQRNKRYILKVVEEDEIEQYLREKLSGLMADNKPKKKSKENNTNKKKLVVEKLSSKLIIDNNGKPFIEINGVKRPLFVQKNPPETTPSPTGEAEESKEEDVKVKINSLIEKAKEKIDQNPPMSLHHNDVSMQVIRDKINQILTEIQDLINLDFDKYSTIHNDLTKLQNFKEILIEDWKRIIDDDKTNDISGKIRILDDFKEMQELKEDAVRNIASILSCGSSFMTKKLIKILVRLQKLQCVIHRVVEDFGEKIKMGSHFDAGKEIKYIEFLQGLNFIVGQNKNDLEIDLKKERDQALENELSLLDALRKLLEKNRINDPNQLYEETKVLWEIKNIEKLQKDSIEEMNRKIARGQKVRKELKILFDLLRQLENCEEKQKTLLDELSSNHPNHKRQVSREPQTIHHQIPKQNHHPKQKFTHRTIIEDKKPIRLVSNGYTLTAYKVTDDF